MILMCSLTTVLFLGGWFPFLNILILNWISPAIWFSLKTTVLLFSFIWVRSSLPRYRYDQLMRLGWKIFLPLSLAWVFFVAALLTSLNWLP
jgi:NADH-quinone oxidoreductase subunit H